MALGTKLFLNSFLAVLAHKTIANFGHWTPPNNLGGHLEQKIVCEVFLQVWPTKNENFGHWIPSNDFGGIWDKTFC